jgi:glycosyltransferase involved in cell wall biosynthesis
MKDSRLRVALNGVSQKFNIRPSASVIDKFKSRLALPKRFILFLGNTDPKKNLRNVVKGYLQYVADTPDHLPLVILDLDKSKLQHFVPEARAAVRKGDIVLPGYVPIEEMPIAYASADLFLYPSLREGFGLPILESMSAGTAVITSDTSSMPEVAGDAALLVDPNSATDIGRMIGFVLSSKLVMDTLVARGRERATFFSWRQNTLELLRIYEEHDQTRGRITARAA